MALNVAVIGVGGHARQILLPAMAQIPEVIAPVVLATAREETAAAMGARYRLPAVVGYEAALTYPDVEAVIIASHDHERQALDALRAGKHVFTETPGITSREGAAHIRALAAERGLVYAVGSCLRHAPIYRQMRERLAAWRAEASGPRILGVRYYPYVGHFYNLLLYLAGPITHAQCTQTDGGAVTLFRFANGDLGHLAWTAFHNVSLPYEAVDITHPSGRLLAEDGRVLRFDQTPAARAGHPYALQFEQADASLHGTTFSIPYGQNQQLYLRGYIPELEDFAHCVRNGGVPRCGVDDAEATLLVGQAVRRSVEEDGAWVAVEG